MGSFENRKITAFNSIHDELPRFFYKLWFTHFLGNVENSIRLYLNVYYVNVHTNFQDNAHQEFHLVALVLVLPFFKYSYKKNCPSLFIWNSVSVRLMDLRNTISSGTSCLTPPHESKIQLTIAFPTFLIL